MRIIILALTAALTVTNASSISEKPVYSTKHCDCNEVSGLCASANEQVESVMDLLKEEDTDDVGCCLDGCQMHCGTKNRKLRRNGPPDNGNQGKGPGNDQGKAFYNGEMYFKNPNAYCLYAGKEYEGSDYAPGLGSPNYGYDYFCTNPGQYCDFVEDQYNPGPDFECKPGNGGPPNRRNRNLCINMECCLSTKEGPPECVPEGTCKIIQDKLVLEGHL